MTVFELCIIGCQVVTHILCELGYGLWAIGIQMICTEWSFYGVFTTPNIAPIGLSEASRHHRLEALEIFQVFFVVWTCQKILPTLASRIKDSTHFVVACGGKDR